MICTANRNGACGTNAMDARQALAEIKSAFGMVPNLFKAYSHHPPLLEANWHKVKCVMMEGALSRRRERAEGEG